MSKNKFIGLAEGCIMREKMRTLPILDAEDLKTFLKQAESTWRKYHPVKRGRRSEKPLIFTTCFTLLENGLNQRRGPEGGSRSAK